MVPFGGYSRKTRCDYPLIRPVLSWSCSSNSVASSQMGGGRILFIEGCTLMNSNIARDEDGYSPLEVAFRAELLVDCLMDTR